MLVSVMTTTTQEATITEPGRRVAWKLNGAIGTTRGIERTCSLIHRHAVTYDRIQEAWCSLEMSDRQRARLEAREARLEARIVALVGMLPWTDDGPWGVQFGGDPRGYTTKIVAPGDLDGIGVYEGAQS